MFNVSNEKVNWEMQMVFFLAAGMESSSSTMMVYDVLRGFIWRCHCIDKQKHMYLYCMRVLTYPNYLR